MEVINKNRFLVLKHLYYSRNISVVKLYRLLSIDCYLSYLHVREIVNEFKDIGCVSVTKEGRELMVNITQKGMKLYEMLYGCLELINDEYTIKVGDMHAN